MTSRIRLIEQAGERALEWWRDTGQCFFCDAFRSADRESDVPHDPECEVGQLISMPCTCSGPDTAFDGNPQGHNVDCPRWGTNFANRHTPDGAIGIKPDPEPNVGSGEGPPYDAATATGMYDRDD